MSFIEVGTEAKEKKVKLFYEDHGEGPPVILIHGWPLSHRMWEYQVEPIVNSGFRCITYDRRGFGESDKPWEGYNYDTLAGDLNELISKLRLEEVTIVGFSMGGGEVARYIGKFGSSKLTKAALISAVPPFMLQTEDNPDGLEKSMFEEFKEGIRKDRPAFLADFGKKFLNFKQNSTSVSENLLRYYWNIACGAAMHSTLKCIDSFAYTDFREDLKKFDLPTLIVHGDADQIVPIEISGEKSAELIKTSNYKLIKDAPHGLILTHTQEFNKILLEFLKA